MKKSAPRSCLHANYPETGMKCVVCFDGEVVMQTHRASKRESEVAISVKGGPHQIFNDHELEVTVLKGKGVVQVKGGKPIKFDGQGSFVVPANAWVKITAAPFAQFFAIEKLPPVLGDGDDDNCKLR